jgi:hypothetical protein
MADDMRRRLALAWHRHQLRHYAWELDLALIRNDPDGAGAAIAAYDRQCRIIHDLELAGL